MRICLTNSLKLRIEIIIMYIYHKCSKQVLPVKILRYICFMSREYGTQYLFVIVIVYTQYIFRGTKKLNINFESCHGKKVEKHCFRVTLQRILSINILIICYGLLRLFSLFFEPNMPGRCMPKRKNQLVVTGNRCSRV